MKRLTSNAPLTEAEAMNLSVTNLYARLKEYEDTGLEPEEIEKANNVMVSAFNLAVNSGTDMLVGRLKEIIRAEAEDRLLILPCKVGDTVYRICHEYKKGNPFIRAVTFNQNNFWRIVFGGEFGKTVFLTREETEAALTGGADG